MIGFVLGKGKKKKKVFMALSRPFSLLTALVIRLTGFFRGGMMSVWSVRLALVLAGTLIGACEKTCTLHVPLKESKGALFMFLVTVTWRAC